MQIKTTPASEDYLKVIYELTRAGERASTTAIAERMGVAPASTTGMLQKLASAEPPLVAYEKHHGVALTADGERAALEIIRHHRLIETFLFDILGYSWDEVHEEADRLEHVISEDLEERIAKALGNPAYDPHGEPIPSREFQVPDQAVVSLSALPAGSRAVVRQIDASDPALLRYLAEIGLRPGCEIEIIGRSEFDGILRVRIVGQASEQVMGQRVTEKILVEV